MTGLSTEAPVCASELDPAQVVFVTRKWPPAVGGMETWSYRMAEELARLGPVRVVALPGRIDGRPPATWRLLLFPFKVIWALFTVRATTATMHLGDMALWPLGLFAQRVVISAHGTDVAYHRRGGVKGTLYGLYLQAGARLMRRARVIANSSATAAAAAETGWSTAAVVPLATDIAPRETPAGHDGSLLFAGRLVTRKGCGWFVREVLPLLSPSTRLRIAGTAWDASERHVLAHPQVEFLGPLDREALSAAYARAMCVVVPNIEPANGEFEGFGLVACEAAAAGGIVLAARTGGLVEAVCDGETGFLLQSADAPAWAEAIETVSAWSADRRAHFVKASTARAREKYAWPRVARETMKFYGVIPS
ncbi:glycosyltransferase family 4 protein [Tsuneonella sp. HG094]